MAESSDSPIETSVVIPCLNEAASLGTCIRKARQGLAAAQSRGEVIVADNGSTDGSPQIALELGARVIHVKQKGYGHALMGGIEAAKGSFIIMGDADDSYDFLEVPRFVEKLRAGCDLVQGCRLPAGGGKVLAGAMPPLHQHLGNPLFSLLARWWFRAPIHDIYCGMRGFRKEFYESLGQHCTGMEFATEMVIKASMTDGRIAEIPITLHPDARAAGRAPHLRTFRDGWRTLRFLLMYSPRWMYLIPGLLLTALGLAGYLLALPAVRIGSVTFDAHTLLFSTLAIILGYQSVLYGVFVKTFAMTTHLVPRDARLYRWFDRINLEKGLLAGAVSLLGGAVLLLLALNQWRLQGFGRLDYAHTMRLAIPGSLLTMLGFQTILSSFFISILGLRRR